MGVIMVYKPTYTRGGAILYLLCEITWVFFPEKFFTFLDAQDMAMIGT
jgi:hypothetical protein